MGGPMSYQRMRERNNLMHRKPDSDPDPYWRDPVGLFGVSQMLVGDLNRMERDYLNPDGHLQREVIEATGVDADAVARVLRYVLLEQR